MVSSKILKMKSYPSGHLFGIAKKYYLDLPSDLKDKERIKDSESALICLIFSTISFEAFLNELIDDIFHPGGLEEVHARPIFNRARKDIKKEWNHPCHKHIPKVAWNCSVLRKGFTSCPFAEDNSIFLNLCLLFKLRNWFIHHEPFKLGEDMKGEYPKQIMALKPLGILTEIEGKVLSPEVYICNRAAMRWQLNTVGNMIRALDKCIPHGPIYKANFLELNRRWPLFSDTSEAKETSVT